MPLDNLKVGLKNLIKRPKEAVADLVEKFKRQELRVPQIRFPQVVPGGFQAGVERVRQTPLKEFFLPTATATKKTIGPALAAISPLETLTAAAIRKEPKPFGVRLQEEIQRGGDIPSALQTRGVPQGLALPLGLAASVAIPGAGEIAGVARMAKLTPVQKIIKLIEEAKPIRGQQGALYSAERAARSARVAEVGQKISGEAGFRVQLKELKGELPRVQFERIRQNLEQGEIDTLFNQIEQKSGLLPFEKIKTKSALAKLLGEGGGVVPQEKELELLGQVFPLDFVKAIASKQTGSQKLLKGLAEVMNIPRALMASFDLSAPLRQGVFLVGRPKQWVPAFRDMFKFALKEQAYDDLFTQIRSRPTYQTMVESKLALTDLRSPSLTSREEAFMSNWAQKIPGIGKIVRASDRAYTGFLNKLRADTFDDLIRGSKAAGIPQNPELHNSISRFVNAATGRGSLGALSRASTILNSTLFSPRLVASRLNLLNPAFYLGLEPFVRKQAIKSLLTFTGLGTTILGLAAMGGAEVGTDPRSANFGKIKVGNTRFDIWGGFQQYIKLAAQLISGKVVSSTTGKEITLGEGYKPLTRKDILLRFFEAKEAPVLSFATALFQGQTQTGEPFSAPREIAERVIPMAVGDMADLYQEGELGLLWWLPAVFGVGVQTYGRQELVTGVGPLGQPTTEIRPAPSLGEKITKGLFGPQPLRPTAGFSVEAYYDQLLKMPQEEAARIYDQILKTNPDLADKIKKVHKERKAGITVRDKVLKEKGVASGDRALAIFKEFQKLKTNEERAALWTEYRRKGIITDEVSKQLKYLLNQQEPQKQGLKVNLPKLSLVKEAKAAGIEDYLPSGKTTIEKGGKITTEKIPPQKSLGEAILNFLKRKNPFNPPTVLAPTIEQPAEQLKVEGKKPELRVEMSKDEKAINDAGRNPVFKEVKPEASVKTAIKKAAAKFRVPTSLLYDIAFAESSLNPKQVGPTSDVGLFQFTDNTWQLILRYAKDPNSSLYGVLPSFDRYDPETNALAAAYLIKFGQLGRWDASKGIWGQFWDDEELEEGKYYEQRL